MVENRLGRLFTRVFNVPLMIQPEKFVEIMSALEGSNEDLTQVFGAKKAQEGQGASNVFDLGEKVHVIPVHGTLVSRTQGLNALSGLTSYEDIRKELRMAMDGPADMVLLDIMSSGGEGNGLFDLTDEIFESRGKKPIIAMANHYAYSAAYSIASAADEVWTTRTGGVGSVGVVMVHMDQSEFDKKLGVKWTLIHAGEKKVQGNPHEPLSDSAREKFNEIVMSHYKIFTEEVARNRGMRAEDVVKTEADVFFGEEAVSAGLADKVVTFSGAIDSINEMVGYKKSVSMSAPSAKAGQHNPEGEMKSHLDAHAKSIGMGNEKEKKKGGAVKMTKDELKEQFPDLYQEIFEEGKAVATTELTKTFEAEKGQLKDEQATLQARVLDLEKRDVIRTEAEIKANAERIWDASLAESNIPVRLHEKVKKHVDHSSYVKEDVLDTKAFKDAVDAEIKDWETRTESQAVKGFGSSSRDVASSAEAEAKRAEAEDDDDVNEMLQMSGDTQAVKNLKKGGE